VPRLEAGVTALGQRLVVLGGFDTDQAAGLDVTTRIDVLDTLQLPNAMWTRLLPDAPVARHHVQLASIGTTLYLLGGLSGTPNASNQFPAEGDCWALNTQDPNPTWVPIAPMPAGQERGSAAVVVEPPRIYLFGGASTTDALATNIFYDVINDAWCPGAACSSDPTQQLPDLPAPRSHPAVMRRSDGRFIVAGGLAGLTSDTATDTTFVLLPSNSPMTTPWMTMMAMPLEEGGCAYGQIQGQLVCAGGEAGNSALSFTESYDPLMDVWTRQPIMPEPRAGANGAAIGQQLYVVGGASQLVFEPTNTLFIFAPLNTPPGL
jgi:N-acetylneuraminic acid mutarotase